MIGFVLRLVLSTAAAVGVIFLVADSLGNIGGGFLGMVLGIVVLAITFGPEARA